MPEKTRYCFADFEFTCGSPAHRLKSETLSVGAVFCDEDHNVLETFYSTARPNRFPKLTSQCKRLTKLTQAEINQSPDSEEVMARVEELMKKYGVAEIFVWGNFDKPGLLSDRQQHIQFRRPHKSIDFVCGAVRDVQDEMVKEMKLPQAVSIEELASAFGYAPETGAFHNALNDALALYAIHKAVYTTDFRSCEKFIALRQERLDRLAAAKAAQEQRRRETALSVELSPEEKEYYETASANGDEKAIDRFIRLRSKVVNSFAKYPDEERFVMAISDQSRRVRLYPASRYSKAKGQGASVIKTFSRDEFGAFIVEACEKYL